MTQLLTAKEVAEILKVSDRTVLRLAERGDLPAKRIGTQWRFIPKVLDEWIHTKISIDPLSQKIKKERLGIL